MRSVIKKALVAFIVLLAALAMFSCSAQDGDAPKGMQLASADGVPFKLYVPKNWTLNKGSGISGAYLSSSAGISVVVDVFDSEGEELESFVKSSIEAYRSSTFRFEQLSEIEDTTLDSHAAKKVKFSLNYDDVDYTFFRVYAKNSDKFIVFSYKASKDFFERYLPEAEAMLKEFKFCESGSINAPENDKNAPEGMKLASRSEEKYKFYIPSSWIANSKNSSSGGYVSKTDRSNVSFTSYSPRESMSIDGYFEMCEKEYKSIYQSYSREEGMRETTVCGKTARDYRFSFEYEGVQYRSRQVICIYDGMFYIMTYTATAENYNAHAEEVERILSSIEFK